MYGFDKITGIATRYISFSLCLHHILQSHDPHQSLQDCTLSRWDPKPRINCSPLYDLLGLDPVRLKGSLSKQDKCLLCQ